jgi:hypothetical protein
MENLEVILKGIIAGILSAYLIIYGLRPAVPYPEVILELFENLWIFLILLLVNYYVFLWDYTIGILLLLCIIALIFDYVVFTNKGFKKELVYVKENMQNWDPSPRFEKKEDRSHDSFYDMLLDDMKKYEKDIHAFMPGGPSPYDT